jgi:hypothetical protein
MKQPINQIITPKASKVTKPKRIVTIKTLFSSPTEPLSPSQSPIPTQHKFEQLDIETEQQQSQGAKKSQPIIIPSVNNIQKVFEMLNKVVEDQYEYKVVGRDSVKIQPKGVNAYREIRKKLISSELKNLKNLSAERR